MRVVIVSLTVSEDFSIQQLKLEVFKLCGVPVGQQTLQFGLKTISDHDDDRLLEIGCVRVESVASCLVCAFWSFGCVRAQDCRC